MAAYTPEDIDRALSELGVGYVYFAQVQPDHGGPIKIGFTKEHPSSRLKSIQVGCPWPITLRGYARGPMSLERQLHRRFEAYRMEGEWFLPSEELQQVADASLMPCEGCGLPPQSLVLSDQAVARAIFVCELCRLCNVVTYEPERLEEPSLF